MWIIASIPFWIIGAVLFVCATSVLAHWVTRPVQKYDSDLAVGGLWIMALAGVALYIAVKVAS